MWVKNTNRYGYTYRLSLDVSIRNWYQLLPLGGELNGKETGVQG